MAALSATAGSRSKAARRTYGGGLEPKIGSEFLRLVFSKIPDATKGRHSQPKTAARLALIDLNV
jgi:hypothetical protein